MNKDLSKVTAVVPSLNPDEKLPRVVESLLQVGFGSVVVVDDGSDEAHRDRFDDCTAHPGVTLLRHESNLGKGAAMKTAFRYILDHMPDCLGAVTVDGDAQHHPDDCRNCALRMLEDDKVVLGVRDFSQPDVPGRSRMGNRITSLVFRLFCGMKISDTQTGLRAFPQDLLPKMLEVKGERYEYETQMLLDFKTYQIPYEEVKIRTVYIEENQTSHFRVVRDSFRIYRLIFAHFVRYVATSIGSYLIEWGLMTLTLFLLNANTGLSLLAKTAISFGVGRTVSSLFNVTMNHFVVFRAKCSFGRSFYKYYVLALPLALLALALNLLGVQGVSLWGFLPEGMNEYAQLVIHPIVQVVLFLITYGVQREWVYRTDKKHKIQRNGREN